MESKVKDPMMAVSDAADGLRRVNGVLKILTYLGETGGIIDPTSLVYTVTMALGELDRQIEALDDVLLQERGGCCA